MADAYDAPARRPDPAPAADADLRRLRRPRDPRRHPGRLQALWEIVERITGLPFQSVVDFFAIGMLMNVAAAMDLPSVDERWTSWCPKDADDCPKA